MITRFLRPNLRTPSAKRRAGAQLLNAIQNQVAAADLRRLGRSAKALHEYRTKAVPLTGDVDSVYDRSEVFVKVPEEALAMREGRGDVPGPRGGRWH